MMAPLVAQMDEGTMPLVRACAIFKLAKLRACTLMRLCAPCALKSCWRCSATGPCIFVLQIQKSHHSRFPRFRRILLAEPRAATVLLLRDGLACCRLGSRREWVSPELRFLHSAIAGCLAKLIVESCDDGDASCGSLVEAEGMLREVLRFVDLIEDDSWQHKASILKAIAELLEKQGRHEEAVRAKQDLADLLQEHGVAPRATRRRRGRRRGGRARGSRGGGV